MHRLPSPSLAAAAALALGNAAVVVALWSPRDIHDTATLLTGLGRLCGLLGAYLALVQLLSMALVRRMYMHRWLGFACLWLLVAHTVLITAGYALGDRISLWDEVSRLISGYPGIITAVAGLVALIAVGVTSAVIVRRRLRYETWYFVHLYAYLGVALGFSHQLATGSAFVGRPVAVAYWYALYAVTLGSLIVFRLALPIGRSLRHRLQVTRVSLEAPDVVSLEVGGRRLERLRARPGQYFVWRFLTRRHWWEAHPFSLSAAPDGRRLRITVKALGDHSRSLRDVEPGTRVIVEGPFGGFTAARRPVALIAGGVGITPIRALLEELSGDVAVVYRASRDEDLILRAELDELAHVHYVVGDEPLTPERLLDLVPDLAQRDVFVCGPRAMIGAVRATGVPRRQVFVERFAY
ncbi:MAG TPA: ferredoxin reductase family protein [Solirubrobacteraceae bacterium]|nr:ferredoxin reductase family protein [Solirubrobacteraceae bacterium]